MPLDLVLVRHGVTDWNESGRLLGRTPIGINLRGRRQAAAVAEALREIQVRRIFVSPQRRTQETAEPIAAALGASVTVESALDEVWLGERWQGRTFDDIRDDPDFCNLLRDPTYVCDVIEPACAVRDRVAAFVEGLRARTEPEVVVLVSHGDPLRVLVAHCIGMPLQSFRALTISNGSISALRFEKHGTSLRALNYLPVAGSVKQLFP